MSKKARIEELERALAMERAIQQQLRSQNGDLDAMIMRERKEAHALRDRYRVLVDWMVDQGFLFLPGGERIG